MPVVHSKHIGNPKLKPLHCTPRHAAPGEEEHLPRGILGAVHHCDCLLVHHNDLLLDRRPQSRYNERTYWGAVIRLTILCAQMYIYICVYIYMYMYSIAYIYI